MKPIENKDRIDGFITLRELFCLYRRRFKLNQEQFGKMFGVSQAAVNIWENGRGHELSKNFLAAKLFLEYHYKEEILDGLREHEVCYIIRHRLGLTQDAIASRFGVSRVWLNRIEQGLEPRLTHKLFEFMIEIYNTHKQKGNTPA